MKIKTVLFDLDGTLLPMDQDNFAKAYIGGLVKTAAPAGYDPKTMADAIMAGTAAMVKNTGEQTNETVFWNVLCSVFGEKVLLDTHIFDEFYRTDFQKIKDICGFTPRANDIVKHLKQHGMQIVLATNPLFPRIATESRIQWAGLDAADFAMITTYETSRFCKPNPDYYRDILQTLDVSAEECLMVGNDAAEDMIASELGMNVFLLTDCLINRNNADISKYPHGGFDDLQAFCRFGE